MVQINRRIEINLNKVLDFVLPKKQKYKNERMVYYVRVYTDFVRAEENLSDSNYGRMINYLKVVRNMTKNAAFKEEEVYMKRLYELANEVLIESKKIQKEVKKLRAGDSYSDPYGARTRLQLGQNICILRLLRGIEE